MDNSFRHVDEAVALAASLLPEDALANKAIARQWAYLALKDIGPGDHWFAQCTLYPDSELALRKPDDMWKSIDIALFDRSGCELRYSYKGLGTRIHNSKNNLINNEVYAPQLGAPIDLSEDTYFYHLGSNASQDNVNRVSYAIIKYWKLPIDNDGLPLIPEGQLLAIAHFIRWMWTIKKGDNMSDRQQSYAEYLKARQEARNVQKLPNGISMTQIGKDWTSLLNAPQFKQF